MDVDHRELLWRVLAREYEALLAYAAAATTSSWWRSARLDPADVLHEAIRRQAVAGRVFRDAGHCVAALRLVMRSVCANEGRRLRRGRGGEALEQIAGPEPASESVIAEALGCLRERDARLATLVERCLCTGRSPSDVSAELGIAASTARHRWARALDELRRVFGCG